MNWGTRQFCICVAAAALLSAVTHARAAPRDQMKACSSEEASADQRIENCTAIIDQQAAKPGTKKKNNADTGNDVSGKDKAAAYFSRGKAYRAKNDSDRAIRDFDEAIKLNSTYAEAYFSRGLA